MIIGDPSVFAIESVITCAYERVSFRALGFFVIHIRGRSFGVRAPDASLLACSFDAVQARIARRGSHTAPFVIEGAVEIADAILHSIYAPKDGKRFFDMSQSELCAYAYLRNLVWAPDGDAAFDDGGHVLQFDAADRVRLIGFRIGDRGHCDPATLADLWLEASAFYAILDQWWSAFLAEWRAAPKIAEDPDPKRHGE